MIGFPSTAPLPGWSLGPFLQALFSKSGEYELLLESGRLIFRVATNTGGGTWDKEVEITHTFGMTNWYNAVLWIEPGVEIGLSLNAGTPQTESLATGQAARVINGAVYISPPVYSSYSYPSSLSSYYSSYSYPSSFAMMEESEESLELVPYYGIVDEIAVFDAALSEEQRDTLWYYGSGYFWHAEHDAWGPCGYVSSSWYSSFSYPSSYPPSSSSSSSSSSYSSYYYSSWVGFAGEGHSSKAAPAPVTEGLLSLAVSELPEVTLCQYVWGARPGHRDELVLRDRDTNFGGEFNERLYCLMDYYDPTSAVDPEGEVVERYGFSAFGVRTVMGPDWSTREESLFDWSFGFHGQFLDGETGYYNYGYRYYVPWLGRWPNRDPIGENGGVNVYGFAGNGGVNRLDFLGLACCPESGGEQYNEETHCCYESKVHSKIEIDAELNEVLLNLRKGGRTNSVSDGIIPGWNNCGEDAARAMQFENVVPVQNRQYWRVEVIGGANFFGFTHHVVGIFASDAAKACGASDHTYDAWNGPTEGPRTEFSDLESFRNMYPYPAQSNRFIELLGAVIEGPSCLLR